MRPSVILALLAVPACKALAVQVSRGAAVRAVSMTARCAQLAMAVVEEDAASIQAQADAVFNLIDVDGNGGVSFDELRDHLVTSGYAAAAVEKIFNKLDADADGELSKEELRDGFVKFAALRSAPGLGSYNAAFVEEIYADADTLFDTVDANDDGGISDRELRVHMRTYTSYSDSAISAIFANLDANEDGEVSRDELREAFVKSAALRQALGMGPNFK